MRYKRRLAQTAGQRVRVDPARSRDIVKRVLERSAANAPLIFPQESPAPKPGPGRSDRRSDTTQKDNPKSDD
jgi:hypothetical protein